METKKNNSEANANNKSNRTEFADDMNNNTTSNTNKGNKNK